MWTIRGGVAIKGACGPYRGVDHIRGVVRSVRGAGTSKDMKKTEKDMSEKMIEGSSVKLR